MATWIAAIAAAAAVIATAIGWWSRRDSAPSAAASERPASSPKPSQGRHPRTRRGSVGVGRPHVPVLV